MDWIASVVEDSARQRLHESFHPGCLAECSTMCAYQPQPEELGYEAALDLGVSALEGGLAGLAVGHLAHAANLRPTRFALVQLAKAHRDLGQTEAARNRLYEARQLPDGKDIYVLVSLAAVLCDLRDYGVALEVVQEAVEIDPDSPAALSTAARCMKELAATLERSPHIDASYLTRVREQADEFARRAAETQPDSAEELVERRRRRATLGWLAPSKGAPSSVPVEQSPAVVVQPLDRTAGPSDPERIGFDAAPVESSATTAAQSLSWWQRGWNQLRSLLGSHR